MKRDSSFCLACFLSIVSIVLASHFDAYAAPAKTKAEVSEKKISFDTGKKDKKGKSVRREFPVMFDIALKSQKHKDKKAGKK